MPPTRERREPRFVYLSDAVGEQAVRPQTRYAWRLDAANHRPLGRAVAAVRSLDHCVAAARALRTHFERAELAVSASGARAQWTWRLTLAGTPVAVSPHGFARRVECQRAFAHFAAALQVADPVAGVLRNYGPRALRGFDLDLRETPDPPTDRTASR